MKLILSTRQLSCSSRKDELANRVNFRFANAVIVYLHNWCCHQECSWFLYFHQVNVLSYPCIIETLFLSSSASVFRCELLTDYTSKLVIIPHNVSINTMDFVNLVPKGYDIIVTPLFVCVCVCVFVRACVRACVCVLIHLTPHNFDIYWSIATKLRAVVVEYDPYFVQ